MGEKTNLKKKFSFWIFSIVIIFFLLEALIRSAFALTSEEEKRLGEKVFLEMEKSVELVTDLTLQSFIERVGYSLLVQVDSTPFKFKFYLIKSPDPNAFAIPGGYIFLTTGLIVLAESEQEIAGVLSHEISHVTARHIAQMIERSKKLNIATLAAIVAGALVGRGGTGSQAVATAAIATSEALSLKYSRENETEADQNGLYRMVKAGYDPNGMITFLNKIYRMSLSTASQMPVYLETHPAIEDRISLLENLLQTRQKTVGSFKKVGNFKRVQSKAFVEERKPEVAVNHFESIVKTNPQDVNGIYGLGLAFNKMGRLDKSTEVFQDGLSLFPKDPDLLRELGIVHFFSGKLDWAIENLKTVRSISLTDQDTDLSTLYYLGRAWQEKGDFAKALPLFLTVRKEMPEFIEVYLNLGSVYGRINQKGLSHFYFGKYFKLKRESKNALLHFKTALEILEEKSPEREESQREIQELTSPQ